MCGVSLWFFFSVSEIHHYLAMRDGGKLLQLFSEKIIHAFNQTKVLSKAEVELGPE